MTIAAQALLDYDRFSTARVTIFVDLTDAARTYRLLAGHGSAIARLAALFSARVLLVEQQRLLPEQVVEQELADAWVLLVGDGRGRALATKKNPQRINLDARDDWEGHAFQEIVRQILESTRIIERVAGHYGRLAPPPARTSRPRPH